MAQFLAIVAYRCLVAGESTGSLDIQVRWYEADDEATVRTAIAAEPLHGYRNDGGETVAWELAEVMAVDRFAPRRSGDEVVGFIASIGELRRLA